MTFFPFSTKIIQKNIIWPRQMFAQLDFDFVYMTDDLPLGCFLFQADIGTNVLITTLW